jgi:hypothetical protein
MYDMALLSWHLAFNPPLPLASQPAPERNQFQIGQAHPHIKVKDLDKAARQGRELLGSSTDNFTKEEQSE